MQKKLIPTVSGPFLPQLLPDSLLLLAGCAFDDLGLSSSTVCKTAAALKLQAARVKELRVDWGS